MNCSVTKRVSFQVRGVRRSFEARPRGCPKKSPTAAQLQARERLAATMKLCVVQDGGHTVKTLARDCVGPLLRGEPLRIKLRNAPKAPQSRTRGSRTRPENQLELMFERRSSPQVAGCLADAQSRARSFCERFTRTASIPELAAAKCEAGVRHVFGGACRGA